LGGVKGGSHEYILHEHAKILKKLYNILFYFFALAVNTESEGVSLSRVGFLTQNHRSALIQPEHCGVSFREKCYTKKIKFTLNRFFLNFLLENA
jgi:hypothetical protein